MSDDLVSAAFEGDAGAVGRLLDAGADIDRHGRSWIVLLESAVKRRRPL